MVTVTEKFVSEKKTWCRVMDAGAPASVVFPLFCPVKEYDWIPTWNCEMVQTESGVAEDMCVFKTGIHQQNAAEFWVCTRYERDRRIEYTRFLPERITRLKIILQENDVASSCWFWETTMIGLNEEGNSYIREYDETRQFFSGGECLESLLNLYLQQKTEKE